MAHGNSVVARKTCRRCRRVQLLRTQRQIHKLPPPKIETIVQDLQLRAVLRIFAAYETPLTCVAAGVWVEVREGGGSTTGCLCLHLDTGDTQLTWPGSSPTLLTGPPQHYRSALSTLCWSPSALPQCTQYTLLVPLNITTVHSVNCYVVPSPISLS